MLIRLLSTLSDGETVRAARLYAAAGWTGEGGDCSFVRAAVAGSFLAAGAFEGEQLVGMGRVLSDGCSDAYIQDVVVDPGFRGRGIGGRIVMFLVGELQARGVDWIALVGEPGTENFYARLGFERKDGFVLWKWNGSREE
ncbi:MAG: GNAT family N-acetyltransferase [Lentisphaeria bacterium]|nr:GNAT family N-acetyltransferase [Lentisphaeria bacterium]